MGVGPPNFSRTQKQESKSEYQWNSAYFCSPASFCGNKSTDWDANKIRSPKWDIYICHFLDATDSPHSNRPSGTSRRRASSCCTVDPQIMRTPGWFSNPRPSRFWPALGTATPLDWSADPVAPAHRTQGSLKPTRMNRQSIGQILIRVGSGRAVNIASFYHDEKLQSRFAAIKTREVCIYLPNCDFLPFFLLLPLHISKCALSAARTRIVFLRSASKCAHLLSPLIIQMRTFGL